jgi:hypothetical protein
MSTTTEDRTTQNQITECPCREQIGDILTRLETLEREALTERKLADLPRSDLMETIAKMVR